MPLVVSDTSPIRALNHIGLFDALPAFFGEILVPPAVVGELSVAAPRVQPIDLARYPFLRIQAPSDADFVRLLRANLGAGEAEAIALCAEVRADAILIDELAGRRAAKVQGLRPIGTLGVLLRAKRIGRAAEIGPLIDRLQSEISFRVSDDLRRAVLEEAGESP